MNFALALQIINFLVSHKDDIKALVVNIENLVGDVPGSQKAQMVKGYIGAAMNVADQIESAWPIVSPIFNGFVALAKKPA